MSENTWFNRIFLLAACCAVVITASAADPVPNILVNGEIADALEINANFQALVDQIAALETQLAAQSA